MKRVAMVASLISSFAFGAIANTRPFLSLTAPDGDKHEHKDGDDHKGEKHELGEKAIGGYTVNVAQFGEIKPGEEAVFVVTLSVQDKPKAVRGWVGVESGERSIKSKAEDEGKEFHLHHPVSKPLPEKSKLWIEIESANGKAKASFDTK